MTELARLKNISNKLLLPLMVVLVLLLPDNIQAGSDGVCSGKPIKFEELLFDPKRLELSGSSGEVFRLSGILLIAQGDFSATIGEQTNSRIAVLTNRLFGSGKVTNMISAGNRDRFGRQPVNVYLQQPSGRTWLQEELVKYGLAIVHPEKDGDECTILLLSAEIDARKMRRGIWKSDNPVIMKANDIDWQARSNSYQLVEGKVVSVGKTRKRVYLNFGTNWQEDFTVVIANKYIKRFKDGIGDFDTLAGKTIRIRGWLASDRGPLIEVYYPGQIELELD